MSNFKRVDTTANRLRIAMQEAGKKQIDLVRETGIDRGAVCNYLKGKYEPKQDSINKLAKALDVSEMWLWGYDCEKQRPVEQKNNDAIADIILRLRTDKEFFEAVSYMYSLDCEKVSSVKQMLFTFTK